MSLEDTISPTHRRNAIHPHEEVSIALNKLLWEDAEVRKDLEGHETVSGWLVFMYGAPGFATTSLSFLIAVYANDFYGRWLVI